MPAPGTQTFHCFQRRLKNAAHCAAPSGMGGSDNARPGIGHQNRPAVRRDNAHQQPRCGCCQSIGPGPCITLRRCTNHNRIGAMDLIGHGKIGSGKDGSNRPAAVFLHSGRFIACACAELQSGHRSGGNTASPRQKSVRHIAEHGRPDRTDSIARFSQGCGSPVRMCRATAHPQRQSVPALHASAPHGPAPCAASARAE